MSQVAENLKRIREKMAEAALRRGRRPDEVQLIAVTKNVDQRRIEEAIEAGVTILGENYVQEAKDKIKALDQQVRWDFIGYLQRNKVRLATDLFEMIHSVDRLSLALELNQAAKKKNKKVKILMQVNISGEQSKSGITPEQAPLLAQEIASLENLSLEGLMTIPPYDPNPEKARPYFAALRELKDNLRDKLSGREGFRELSMGMSGDFEVAIEEGATLVRIGTAIFGERR